MNKKKNTDEVADFLGRSDSESSDWDDLNEAEAKDFLKVPEKKKKTHKNFAKDFSVDAVAFNLKPKTNPKPAENRQQNVIKQMSQSKSMYFVAKPTKVRIDKPELTEEEWQERTTDRTVVPVSKANTEAFLKRSADTNWLMVGVITQIVTKKSKKDTVFCYWFLNDLDVLDKSLKMFLFGKTYQSHWKLTEGTVVAILMPKVMDSEGFSDKAFTVDNPLQILILGRSPDLGKCEGKTKSGEKCSNIVNKGDCTFCSYHLTSSYFAATKRPGFLNIAQQTLNKNKRGADPYTNNHWGQEKRARMDNDPSVKVNANVGLAQLNKSGITHIASSWGLLDRREADSLRASTAITTPATSAAESSAVVNPLMEKLRRPTTGSLNMVKHIVDRSRLERRKQQLQLQPFTFASVKQQLALHGKIPERMVELGTGNAEVDKAKAAAEFQAAKSRRQLETAIQKSGGVDAYNAEQRRKNIEAAMDRSNKLQQKQKENVSEAGSDKNKKQKKPLSEEMFRMLEAGSSNKKLIEVDREIEQDRIIDRLDRQEKVASKLAEMHEEKCFVFVCTQCDGRFQTRPKICVAEGHTITKTEGLRRYFRCSKCNTHTSTIKRYPDQNCKNCAASSYLRAGKVKIELAPVEKPLVDGGNKRWLKN